MTARRMRGRRVAVGLLTCAVVAAGSGLEVRAGNSGLPPVLRSQVSTDPGVAAGEAWVTTDARHPERVAVIWLGTRDTSNLTNFLTPGYCGVGVSTDFGRTWKRRSVPFAQATNPQVTSPSPELPICGDPVAGAAPDGTLHVAAGNVGSTSITQAVTAVDGPAGAWSSWSAATEVDPDIQSRTGAAHSAANGTIAIVYTVDTTSPYYLTSPSPAVTCPEGTACPVLATTRDRGKTWTRRVIPYQGTPPGAFAFASQIVAADPSRAGRFAVLFPADAGGLEVWLTQDTGRTWRRTTRFTAPAGESLAKPWISYSPTGALGVVWRTTHANGRTDVIAVVSRDGGTSFSSDVPLATGIPAATTVTPGDDCACNLHLNATTLSATWSDTRTGQRQIYYGRFDYTKLRVRR